MELTRKQVINTLETLKLEWGELAPPEDNICDALDYAISSLKTDEAYQLMYEGGEVFTKADMVVMLTMLQSNISELKSYESADGQDLVMLADIGTLFQQKINNLKED